MNYSFNPQDAEFLKANYGVWEFFRATKNMKMLDNATRGELLNIYRRNLDSRALFCMHCAEEVATMVNILFTNYDRWTERQTAAALNEVPIIDQVPAGDITDVPLDIKVIDELPAAGPEKKKPGRPSKQLNQI